MQVLISHESDSLGSRRALADSIEPGQAAVTQPTAAFAEPAAKEFEAIGLVVTAPRQHSAPAA